MKRICAIAVFLILSAIFSGIAFAANGKGLGQTEGLRSDEAAIDCFVKTLNDADFGGVYFDDSGKLIVHLVEGGAVDETSFPAVIGGVEAEYDTVTYSLAFLEDAKDLLVPYMLEYSILVLDANEVTNKVDIHLKDYNLDTIEALTKIVEDVYPEADFLNFIDKSGSVIRFTAAS